MRIFKHRVFRQWARSEKLSDSALNKAVNEIQKGLFDANLGSGLYKKRVAKKGKGKSGSYRTILAFKRDDRAVFMYGFAKNQRDNLTSKEEDVYKKLAREFLSMTDQQISTLITNGNLFEVNYEEIKDDKKTKKS